MVRWRCSGAFCRSGSSDTTKYNSVPGHNWIDTATKTHYENQQQVLHLHHIANSSMDIQIL
eukprot:159397-Amphidinium_carterae.1